MKLLSTAICFLMVSLCLPADRVNEDRPEKGTWDLEAEKVWEVSKYGRQSMAIPNVGGVLDNGTICVFDYKYRTNYLFNADGKFISWFGKKGEGPGEVKNQNAIFVLKDKIIVGEYGKLHYYSDRGEYLRSILLKQSLGAPLLFINENEYISLGAVKHEFFHFNLLDGSKRIMGVETDLKRANIASGRLRVTVVIPPLTPEMVFAFDPKNKWIFYGKNDEYQINIIDFGGKFIKGFSLKRKSRMLTKKMKRKLNKEMPLSKKMCKRLPKKLTFFYKIQIIDQLILIYVTHFEEYFKTQHIDVFSSDGTYLYRTGFVPESGEKIYSSYRYKLILKNGYLYAAIQKKNGDMKVVKYNITLPEASLPIH